MLEFRSAPFLIDLLSMYLQCDEILAALSAILIGVSGIKGVDTLAFCKSCLVTKFPKVTVYLKFGRYNTKYRIIKKESKRKISLGNYF